MRIRRWILGLGLAAIIAASFLAYLVLNRGKAPQAVDHSALAAVNNAPVPVATPAPVQTNVVVSAPPVISLDATQVLATVNGHQLTLADLMPMSGVKPGQKIELSPETYHFLLDRAINRELILQTARAQGVELDDSQRAQLENFRETREQPEPNLIQRLNDPGQLDFETRDAEAFMLQTSLLALAGDSPNVTADEVLQYYNQHISEYGELPTDPSARSQAWSDIESSIREALAPVQRAQYQNAMQAFMGQIRSSANITVASTQ